MRIKCDINIVEIAVPHIYTFYMDISTTDIDLLIIFSAIYILIRDLELLQRLKGFRFHTRNWFTFVKHCKYDKPYPEK